MAQSQSQVPVFELGGGVQIPAIGFGVYQTPPEETVDAVTAALETGYRHVDTAAAYGNEREVGKAIASSGLARDDVFIETKIWPTDYGYESTLHAFDKSVGKLGLDHVDRLRRGEHGLGFRVRHRAPPWSRGQDISVVSSLVHAGDNALRPGERSPSDSAAPCFT